MSGLRRFLAYLAVACAWTGGWDGALSQEPAPGPSPALTAPAPAAPNVPPTYGPLDAGQEAYQQAEARRQASITGQVVTEQAIAARAALSPYHVYIPAAGAVVTPGYAYLPRRGVWAYRYYPYVYPYVYVGPQGYVPSWSTLGRPWYAYPYLGEVPQPMPERALPADSGERTGARRPAQKESPKMQSILEPPGEGPALIRPAPEPIPAPPAESGPREF